MDIDSTIDDLMRFFHSGSIIQVVRQLTPHQLAKEFSQRMIDLGNDSWIDILHQINNRREPQNK